MIRHRFRRIIRRAKIEAIVAAQRLRSGGTICDVCELHAVCCHPSGGVTTEYDDDMMVPYEVDRAALCRSRVLH